MNVRPWFMACVLATALAGNFASAAPQNYLFTDSDELSRLAPLLKRPDIGGAQIVYTWKSLEPARDQYDFTQIEKDLRYLEGLNRKLFIQLQDRFFEIEHRNVPLYLQTEPVYGGGLVPQADNPGENKPDGHGWATQQWNPAVRERYQRCSRRWRRSSMAACAGINLPGVRDRHRHQERQDGLHLREIFRGGTREHGVCAQGFREITRGPVRELLALRMGQRQEVHVARVRVRASSNGIGLGGPDIVPYKKAQMKNSYPFFHQYKGKLSLVAMAVQEPTLTYTNPETKKPFTREEFVAFAQDYLGVDIIFWATASPWLKDPKR